MNDSQLISILLPDLRGGGAERVNINLANEFVVRGFAVDVVLMCATGELITLLDPRVRVIELGAKRMRDVLWPLTRYLRDTRPSSLLACMWPLTIIGTLGRLAARVETRVVVAEHTTWSADAWYRSPRNRFLLSISTRWAYRRADAAVTVSQGAAEDMASIAQLPRNRVKAIYNPIVGGAKSVTVDEAPELLAWARGTHRKILAVGTLKAIKDYATLLQAFSILHKDIDAKLLILGEGGERVKLERLSSELGIDAHVFMPGFTQNSEVFFDQADLHVLSSTGEGFGNVIVEALEHGTPVVSTDCPSGPREILDNGRYGTLVPVGDPKALAQAMLDALARTHDKAALRTRAADFSVTNAADAYLDLLLPNWRQHAPPTRAHN